MKSFNKRLTIVLVSLLFLTLSYCGKIFAANKGTQSNGKPFEELLGVISDLKDQINNLQNQINSIELAPGPQGPKGDKGETGSMGPQGQDGQNGATGLAGFNSLVNVVNITDDPRCEGEGIKIESGLDNGNGEENPRDGILGPGEVQRRVYLNCEIVLPIANAGPDQILMIGNYVTLDGSASNDPLGDPLTYSWSFFSKPENSNAVIDNPSTEISGFDLDVEGQYSVQLIVNNGLDDSLADFIVISSSTREPFIVFDTNQTGDYTTVFGEDSDYSQENIALVNNYDGTLTDTNTGLMWADNVFGGTENLQRTTQSFGFSTCNNLNATEMGSYSDWRLATVYEIMTLIDLEFPTHFRSADFKFPDYHSNYWSPNSVQIWAATVNPSNPSYAFIFQNQTLRTGGRLKSLITTAVLAMCVRGPELKAGFFIDNKDGTVFNELTGLTWSKTADTTMNWESAIEYCEQLVQPEYSKNDWRLPNIKELYSIVDELGSPTIDLTVFPDTESSHYWSSTTTPFLNSKASTVNFSNTQISDNIKSSEYYVRCVRGGP